MIHGFGLIVSPLQNLSGDGTLYAEVVPAGSRWLPLPGRTSRWWYEVHEKHAPDENGVDTTTLGYDEGGSGGGFTLRSCIARATEAVERFAMDSTLPVATGGSLGQREGRDEVAGNDAASSSAPEIDADPAEGGPSSEQQRSEDLMGGFLG